MSAYQVEKNKYSNVREAIEDSFVEGYEVHYVTEAKPNLFYVIATSPNGTARIYDYRVEIIGGMYSMRACTVGVDDAVQSAPDLEPLAKKYGCF